MRWIAAALAVAILTGGCAIAPSISVLGAYFPDWLFCSVAGAALTIIAYVILERAQSDDRLVPPIVIYPTLITLFSLSVWLILFQH
ncbi:YtcA family lipoprotein [Paraburkholderia sp. BL23I1N1]|uniref:YtcA family lipoprotein n=1 Tax=Paraburkholderia sp. BL23I1N1 TaxID=1938802 RepID=UPI000E75BA1D|nr:YtcA family lipoprotein [Paraburkholderia sp. BL23I1N1]